MNQYKSNDVLEGLFGDEAPKTEEHISSESQAQPDLTTNLKPKEKPTTNLVAGLKKKKDTLFGRMQVMDGAIEPGEYVCQFRATPSEKIGKTQVYVFEIDIIFDDCYDTFVMTGGFLPPHIMKGVNTQGSIVVESGSFPKATITLK